LIKDLKSVYEQIVTDKHSLSDYGNLKFACDENGETLLHLAVIDEKTEIVKDLFSVGACPFMYNGNGMTALGIAAANGSLQILKFLFENCEIGLRDYNKAELLAFSAANNNFENVEYLLKSGVDPNSLYREDPIIYWAVQSENLEIIKLLFEYGADLNQSNDEGMTALYDAAANGLTDIAKFLIENGADINKPSDNGTTPLIIACCFDKIETARLLIENECDMEARANNGETALLASVRTGNIEIVRLLLSGGADIIATDKKVKVVKDYCKKIRSKKIRRQMEELLDEKIIEAKETRKKIDTIDAMADDDIVLDDSHFAILKSLSSDKDAFVRSRSAALLINFESEESLDLLLKLSGDDDAFVRTEAYDSLSVFHFENVEKTLYQAIISENDELARRYAILSWTDVSLHLYDNFGDKISFVLNKLETEDSDGCLLDYYRALHLFGHKGALDPLEKMIEFLKNDYYAIRCAALNELIDAANEDNSEQIKRAVEELLKTEETIAVKSSAVQKLQILTDFDRF